MTMLWRVDDHTVTLSCIPIEAQVFLATHEWEIVPPVDAKRITEANPPIVPPPDPNAPPMTGEE